MRADIIVYNVYLRLESVCGFIEHGKISVKWDQTCHLLSVLQVQLTGSLGRQDQQ